jgi:type I restriction enzyme M protein
MATNNNNKSLESWIWDAGCSIRGAKDAPKYKEFILPLIFAELEAAGDPMVNCAESR